MESIRLGGPAHGILTKTVHKTLPGVVGSRGWVGGWVGGAGGPGVGGKRVKGSRGLGVVEGPGSREPRGIG